MTQALTESPVIRTQPADPAAAPTVEADAALTDFAVEIEHEGAWVRACRYADLIPGRGAAVLLGTAQAAVFRDRAGRVYAVQNYDPFSASFVISRGILGSRGSRMVVASPMYKQAFDLLTGECLDEDTAPDGTPARLRVWAVRFAPLGG